MGVRRSFLASLAATAAGLLLAGTSGAYIVQLVLRLLVGVTGAVTFVTGASLVAHGSSRHRSTLLSGIYFSGGGIGILVSAAIVPALAGAHAWRAGWLLLGLIATAALVICAVATRLVPEPGSERRAGGSRLRLGPLAPTFVAYTLFGAGYIGYMTFVVAFVEGTGAGPAAIAVFWVALGAAAVASPFWWAPVTARASGGGAVGLTLLAVTVGAILPLAPAGYAGILASGVIFGAAFLAVVNAATMVARRVLEPELWTRAIGALTVAFGLGQTAGPLLSGALSVGAGGVRAGLVISALLLVAGLLAALAQRPRRDQP